jgi:Flp pilus assembly protein TadG
MLLVPLLLILLGTIDWGYYLYVRAIVTDAARAGARAGSLVPPLSSAQPAAISASTAFLGSLGIPRPGETLNVDPSTGPAGSVCVQIALTTHSISGFRGLDASRILPETASARACMRLEP